MTLAQDAQEKIIADYLSGMTQRAVATAHEVHVQTVRKYTEECRRQRQACLSVAEADEGVEKPRKYTEDEEDTPSLLEWG